MRKEVAISVLVYFTVALAIMSTGFFYEDSWPPIFLSLFSLIPIYLWKKSYEMKAELSVEIDGRPLRAVLLWALALFLLALIVRIPSVLLFKMPYEKAPLIYLIILTTILVERTDPSAMGFKTQKMVKALLYGATFYIILHGTALLAYAFTVYAYTSQMVILSFDIFPFLISIPFQILLVGISEEGLFRGYIQTHIEKYHVFKAIFVQAVLFGFWHFVWNLSPFSPTGMARYITATFFLGLIFGYFYSKAGNLVPLILAHGLWNSFQSGIMINYEVANMLSRAPFLTLILVEFLPYTMAALTSFLFIKYGIKKV